MYFCKAKQNIYIMSTSNNNSKNYREQYTFISAKHNIPTLIKSSGDLGAMDYLLAVGYPVSLASGVVIQAKKTIAA